MQGLYNLCSESNGPDQLRGAAQLICAFFFAYAKIRFSHDRAYKSKVLLKCFWSSALPIL